MTESLAHRALTGPQEDIKGYWWVTALTQEGKSMSQENLPFHTMEEAFEFNNHFMTSIDPIVLEFDAQGFVVLEGYKKESKEGMN